MTILLWGVVATVLGSVLLLIAGVVWNRVVWKRVKPLWHRLRTGPNVSISVGETFWYGSAAAKDADGVSAILVQVWLTNPSPVEGSASVMRLEVEGFPTYFPARFKHLDVGATLLTGSGETTVGAPSGLQWLPPVVPVGPWGSVVGWVGFVTWTGTGAGITYGQAKSVAGKVIALVAGKGEVSAPIRPYSDTSQRERGA